MRVYRIECPDGDRFGPYGPPPDFETLKTMHTLWREIRGDQCPPWYEVVCIDHQDDYHLTPHKDEILAVRDLYLGNEMRFACTSLETLKDWFAGYFDDLIAIGYVCAEYVTESYTVGKSQRQVGFTEWRSRRVIEI